MKEMIPLSLRQRKAFVWWARREYEDYAAIICDGAIRSGKTLAMGMGFFFWAMACFSDRQFALCGRSVGALRRNLLETVLPQLRRLGFACEEKRSEKLLIVRRRGRENRFYLFGGANEASAALIQGMTLAGVLFDEAALMPRSFVEQASARCSVEGSRLWFSCNPEGPNHWFYREWVCRAEEKRALYEWSFVAVPAQRAAGVVKRFGQGEGSLKAMVRACGSRAQVRELEELEKLSALGKSYLGALRREVRRLMLVADETLDGAVAESVTEKLGERELLELKKAFGARAAKKLGTNVQIVDPREKREENERDFCV